MYRSVSRYQKGDSERFTFPKLQHEHRAEAGLKGHALAAHHCDKITEATLSEQGVFPWYQKFASIGAWPHCLGTVLRQNIMADARTQLSSHSSQETERVDKFSIPVFFKGKTSVSCFFHRGPTSPAGLNPSMCWR